MNSYRLVLIAQGALPERTGYVFCANDDAAREAAEVLLRNNPGYISVDVFLDDRRVCEVVR